MAGEVTRGSRMDILNWVESPEFLKQLNHLLCSTRAHVHRDKDIWMPKGFCNSDEAKLDQLENVFGPELCDPINWNEVWDWWLAVRSRNPNTPNWDLASTCTVNGRRGLVLLEAKSHAAELIGKKDKCQANKKKANYPQIGKALDEAGLALSEALSKILGRKITINITHENRLTHYQLANRVAYSWKIASLGIPVILVYLGFLGDRNWPCDLFKDNDHWEHELQEYMCNSVPKEFLNRWIPCGKEPMQMIVRSLWVEFCYSFSLSSG